MTLGPAVLRGDAARMLGAGFSGPWTELEGSYRMPADLVPIVNEFAGRFLDGELLVAGVPRDRLVITGPSAVTCRRWRDVGPAGNVGRHVGFEVVELLDDDPELSPSDIVFLCETHAEGLQAVRVIEACGHAVHHMFGSDDADRSRRGGDSIVRVWSHASDESGGLRLWRGDSRIQ